MRARFIGKILPNEVCVEIFSITEGLILLVLFSEFKFVSKDRVIKHSFNTYNLE